MSCIYCIENKLNHKKYIGKTIHSLKERIVEHIRDSRKERCKNRPLYSAFNKYGIECFKAYVVKECKPEELSYYETYYICKYNTYGHNGYNATKGGDGSILYNYSDIVYLYQEGLTITDVTKIIGCCYDTVKYVLNFYNIKIRDISKEQSKKVFQYDKNNNLIQVFDSIKDAGRWIISQKITSVSYKVAARFISKCANRQRKTAYKYIWKFE